MVFLVHAMLIN